MPFRVFLTTWHFYSKWVGPLQDIRSTAQLCTRLLAVSRQRSECTLHWQFMYSVTILLSVLATRCLTCIQLSALKRVYVHRLALFTSTKRSIHHSPEENKIKRAACAAANAASFSDYDKRRYEKSIVLRGTSSLDLLGPGVQRGEPPYPLHLFIRGVQRAHQDDMGPSRNFFVGAGHPALLLVTNLLS